MRILTEQTHQCRLLFLGCLLFSFQSLWMDVHATPRMRHLDSLIRDSEIISIVELTEYVTEGKVAKATVLQAIKGNPQSEELLFRYPPASVESMFPPPKPEKGLIVLVFLRKFEDDVYVPTTSLSLSERLSDDGEEEFVVMYSKARGWGSVWRVEKAEVETIAELVREFANWEKLQPDEQRRVILRAFETSDSFKTLITDWLLNDPERLRVFSYEEGKEDVFQALAACLDEEKVRLKRNAVVILGMILPERRETVPLLVHALDDPDVTAVVIPRLDGRKAGPGPELDRSWSQQEKKDALKQWWSESGSKNYPEK